MWTPYDKTIERISILSQLSKLECVLWYKEHSYFIEEGLELLTSTTNKIQRLKTLHTHQLQLTLTLWSPAVPLDNYSDTQQIGTLSLSLSNIHKRGHMIFLGFNIMFIFIQPYVCWLQNQLNNIVQSFIFVFFIISYP